MRHWAANNWLVNGKGVQHTWKGEVLLGTSVAAQLLKIFFACNETRNDIDFTGTRYQYLP
jgi:hypothetical protein